MALLMLEAFSPDTPASDLVLGFARERGLKGFTVDELRDHLGGLFPTNPGAVLGALVSRGFLADLGLRVSYRRSSKGRKVRHFVIAEGR